MSCSSVCGQPEDSARPLVTLLGSLLAHPGCVCEGLQPLPVLSGARAGPARGWGLGVSASSGDAEQAVLMELLPVAGASVLRCQPGRVFHMNAPGEITALAMTSCPLLGHTGGRLAGSSVCPHVDMPMCTHLLLVQLCSPPPMPGQQQGA